MIANIIDYIIMIGAIGVVLTILGLAWRLTRDGSRW